MTVGQVFSPYRVFRGYFLPECLLPYRGVSLGSKICLAVLYRYIGKKDSSWPSQETLAERMGVGLRTVQGYISELEKDGFIKSIQSGLGKSNTYKALWHSVFNEDMDGSVAGLDPLKPAGLDTQEPAEPDTQEPAAPSYSTEESHTEESQQQEQNSDDEETQAEPRVIVEMVAAVYRDVRKSKMSYVQKQGWFKWLDENSIRDLEEFLGEVRTFFRNTDHKTTKWAATSFRKAAQRSQHFVRESRNSASFVNKTPSMVNIPGVETGSSLAVVHNAAKDEQFQQYIKTFAEVGRRTVLKQEAEAAYCGAGERFAWVNLDARQRAGAIRAAIPYCRMRAHEPQYLKSPLNFLKTEPWDAIVVPEAAPAPEKVHPLNARNARVRAALKAEAAARMQQ